MPQLMINEVALRRKGTATMGATGALCSTALRGVERTAVRVANFDVPNSVFIEMHDQRDEFIPDGQLLQKLPEEGWLETFGKFK